MLWIDYLWNYYVVPPPKCNPCACNVRIKLPVDILRYYRTYISTANGMNLGSPADAACKPDKCKLSHLRGQYLYTRRNLL